MDILVFELDSRRFAIPAADAGEVLRAVRLLPLPNAPAIVEGIFDLRGEAIAALDVRSRFGLPPKPIQASDHLLVARAGPRFVALRVDRVIGLARVAESEAATAARSLPASEYVAGIARLPDGLVLIHDLRSFLSEAESSTLAAFLADSGAAEVRR